MRKFSTTYHIPLPSSHNPDSRPEEDVHGHPISAHNLISLTECLRRESFQVEEHFESKSGCGGHHVFEDLLLKCSSTCKLINSGRSCPFDFQTPCETLKLSECNV